MEFPLRRHDGVFHWFLTRVNPLRDSEGSIIRWVGINTDIDDRRQHARTLERLSEIGRTISADLEVKSVLQAVTDAATELSGAQFGAFFYNVVDDGEAYMLYTISGGAKEHFTAPQVSSRSRPRSDRTGDPLGTLTDRARGLGRAAS